MKTISKYVSVLLVTALSFASCSEWMNAGPEGGTKTPDQVEEAAQQNPATAAADSSATTTTATQPSACSWMSRDRIL